MDRYLRGLDAAAPDSGMGATIICWRCGRLRHSPTPRWLTMDAHLFTEARELAAKRHAPQVHSEGAPYTQHLQDVENELRSFGFDETKFPGDLLILCAWLHDLVEDTPTTLQEVTERFGADAMGLVHAVTNEPGKNRHEKFLNTYRKILAHPFGVILKLADRIANVRRSLQTGHLLRMYTNEYDEWQQLLRKPRNLIEVAMWTRLDDLMRDAVIKLDSGVAGE